MRDRFASQRKNKFINIKNLLVISYVKIQVIKGESITNQFLILDNIIERTNLKAIYLRVNYQLNNVWIICFFF